MTKKEVIIREDMRKCFHNQKKVLSKRQIKTQFHCSGTIARILALSPLFCYAISPQEQKKCVEYLKLLLS